MGFSRYCVCCLSIETRQSGDDRLCSSGSPQLSPSGFEAHPGAGTFPSVCGLTTTSFTDPSASRNTPSVSTITDGNAQAGAAAHFPPLRWPDCTLSRLRAEEYDWPVTQSIATPEPSSRTIPTLDRSCRPPHLNVDRFHYPGASRYCHRCTAGCWAGTGEDCRPRTTWRPLTLFGQPGSPSFASHWRFFATPT